MALWQFTPIADPEDPHWLDYPRWSEVVVRARSAGEAIAVASDTLDPGVEQIGNESPSGRNGVEDEKLYRLRRVDPAGARLEFMKEDGPPGLLRVTRQ
jgi:hypothetical protein